MNSQMSQIHGPQGGKFRAGTAFRSGKTVPVAQPRSTSRGQPWLKGPVAWEVRLRAPLIRERMQAEKERCLSLRQVAEALGISTQPARLWIKEGWLPATGPRGRVKVEDLLEFTAWLEKNARPYRMEDSAARFAGQDESGPSPFRKLYRSQFSWDPARAVLTPPELADRIGCHPSLIVKAIRAGFIQAKRRSHSRWEIARQDWAQAFTGTIR